MAKPSLASIVPRNGHPVRIGMDQGGGNKFTGELGRVSLFGEALPVSEIQALAQSDHHPLSGKPKLMCSRNAFGTVGDSAGWDLGPGMTVEAWVKPPKLPDGGARLVDKITAGGSDGFLVDTHPAIASDSSAEIPFFSSRMPCLPIAGRTLRPLRIPPREAAAFT